jgi:hypothetical protein
MFLHTSAVDDESDVIANKNLRPNAYSRCKKRQLCQWRWMSQIGLETYKGLRRGYITQVAKGSTTEPVEHPSRAANLIGSLPTKKHGADLIEANQCGLIPLFEEKLGAQYDDMQCIFSRDSVRSDIDNMAWFLLFIIVAALMPGLQAEAGTAQDGMLHPVIIFPGYSYSKLRITVSALNPTEISLMSYLSVTMHAGIG